MNAARRAFAVVLLVMGCAIVAGPGCVDYDEPGADRVKGNRGYPCLFPEDCAAPLQCYVIDGEANNVCSGPQDLDQACFTDNDCQYKRNYLGLPLTCIESFCGYANDFPPTVQ